MSQSAAQPIVMNPAPPAAEVAGMHLRWDIASPVEWAALLAEVPQSNLLQSFPYGVAMRQVRQMMPRFCVIEVDGEAVGVAQFHEAKVLSVHVITLDRGPLWFTKKVPIIWWRQFLDCLTAEFPNRFLRFRRLMPELAVGDVNGRLLQSAGFVRAKQGQIGHRSIWIDLSVDEEARYKALRSNWRQHLRGAEKASFEIKVEETAASLPWLIARYVEDRRARLYPGPSPRFVDVLARAHFTEGTGFLLRAVQAGEAIAAILVLGHGCAATYQIGWTSDAGRKSSAHHLLLWRAMQLLEARGYTGFDLGGTNPETAEGVTLFKQGMGGTAYELLPVYR